VCGKAVASAATDTGLAARRLRRGVASHSPCLLGIGRAEHPLHLFVACLQLRQGHREGVNALSLRTQPRDLLREDRDTARLPCRPAPAEYGDGYEQQRDL